MTKRKGGKTVLQALGVTTRPGLVPMPEPKPTVLGPATTTHKVKRKPRPLPLGKSK